MTRTLPPWQFEGLCRQDRNPELWERFFAETALERRDARNLCFRCPVRERCLRTALENADIWGVWGGCDEAELRRALAVDAEGKPRTRSRYPQCPMCHARPSNLQVVGVCELPSGRQRERVECGVCGFFWRARTSVAAVKAYWREKGRTRKVAVRATVPRGRTRQDRLDTVVVPLRPSDAPAVTERPMTALAASAAPLS